ncbi:MAG: hypothetical protein GXC73_13925 [Chitinophagaceae bacterium]|nr:hypothetical protein [Chitinophagaceae bacterium]
MKKLLVLSTIVLLAINANAQFQKGNKLLGFGFNAGSTTVQQQNMNFTQINKEELFNLSVELGFAVRPNLVTGFYLNGGTGTLETEFRAPSSTIYTSKLQNLGGGLFIRNYKNIKGDFFVFGEARAGLSYAETKNKTTDFIELKRNNVTAGIYPGLAYKWNSRFLLELRFADLVSLNYFQQNGFNGPSAVNQKSFNIGSSLGLGYLSNIGIGARWIIK